MSRNRIKELITLRLLGRITDSEQQELDRWMAESAANRAVYDGLADECSLKLRYEHWRDIDERAAWRGFADRYFNRRTRIVRRWVAVAASVAVLAVMTFAAWHYIDERSHRPVLAAAEVQAERLSTRSGRQKAVLTLGGRTLEVSDNSSYIAAVSAEKDVDEDSPVVLTTGAGNEFWVTLSDGTIVHLNYGSRLEYPAGFSGDSRDVRLEGEAYFKVAHSDRAEFRVLTPDGTVVRDIGTAFNVNTRCSDGTTRVTLVEGKAEVSRGGRFVILLPGQTATTGGSSAAVHTATTGTTEAVSWNEGRFVFTDCPMTELMGVIGRWYGGNFIIADPGARDIKFSGIIDRYENLSSILVAISHSTGIEIRMTDNQIIIGSKNE